MYNNLVCSLALFFLVFSLYPKKGCLTRTKKTTNAKKNNRHYIHVHISVQRPSIDAGFSKKVKKRGGRGLWTKGRLEKN
jgi:hypothetical protein